MIQDINSFIEGFYRENYQKLYTYASGTVLAKNIFSVYCLQAFRLHKIGPTENFV